MLLHYAYAFSVTKLLVIPNYTVTKLWLNYAKLFLYCDYDSVIKACLYCDYTEYSEYLVTIMWLYCYYAVSVMRLSC